MSEYQVIVGNIGTVYTGTDRRSARKTFEAYVDASQAPAGRASGESITLLRDGDIASEFIGRFDIEESAKYA